MPFHQWTFKTFTGLRTLFEKYLCSLSLGDGQVLRSCISEEEKELRHITLSLFSNLSKTIVFSTPDNCQIRMDFQKGTVPVCKHCRFSQREGARLWEWNAISGADRQGVASLSLIPDPREPRGSATLWVSPPPPYSPSSGLFSPASKLTPTFLLSCLLFTCPSCSGSGNPFPLYFAPRQAILRTPAGCPTSQLNPDTETAVSDATGQGLHPARRPLPEFHMPVFQV